MQAGRLDTRQVVVPQESRHRLQAIWPIPFFRLSSSRIDGRYYRMLNGLALRNGFEAAPKVRKNPFEYKHPGKFRGFKCSKTTNPGIFRDLSTA